jgi:hypothetical protein
MTQRKKRIARQVVQVHRRESARPGVLAPSDGPYDR